MRTENKILIIPDFMAVLVAIDMNPGMNFSQIHYTLRITYSHLHHIKQLMLGKGWIDINIANTDGPNRAHIPTFTEKGKRVLSAVYKLMEELDFDKNDIYKYKAIGKKVREDDNKQGEVPSEVRGNEAEVIKGNDWVSVPEEQSK